MITILVWIAFIACVLIALGGIVSRIEHDSGSVSETFILFGVMVATVILGFIAFTGGFNL